MQVTLLSVERFKTKKDGSPLGIQKPDRFIPFERVVIKDTLGTTRTGNDFDGFTKDWKVGDTVDIEVFQEEWEGAIYNRFRKVSELNLLKVRVEDLERIVGAIQARLSGGVTGGSAKADPNEVPVPAMETAKTDAPATEEVESVDGLPF